MKLKLVIVHLDLVVDTLELEPGVYTLGRGSHNNIVVQHFSLDPEHGSIFFEEGQWFYENLEKSRKHTIDSNSLFKLTDHIALTTQEYVERGDTKLSLFAVAHGEHKTKVKQRAAIVISAVAVLLIGTALSYMALRTLPEKVQHSKLINRVRDKIVEFEVERDDKAVAELKEYAGLVDADFKDSSGFCTGFLIAPNVVLTAAHCLFGRMVIDLNNDFFLKTSDGQKHQIQRVLGFDIKRDFLFLETQGMESYGHLDFASSYEIEQKVFTVGNVHGEGIAIRDGIVSSETSDSDDPTVKFLRYSAGTSPGNSGGPLLNENGDVVALVFAATTTENFNLGTPAADLEKAFEQFVDQRDAKQTIQVQMKRLLNFKPGPMLQALSIPYLPQFDEYPEVSEKFSEVAIDIEVPMDFAQVDDLVLEPLNQKVIAAFDEVQSILRKKNEIILDWKSFATDETPAILPSQFDISQRVFSKINDRYYPLLSGLIDSPSKADFMKYKTQLEKEGKFDFQAYGYNIEINSNKIDLLESDIFYKPQDESGSKLQLQALSFGPPYSQMVVFGNSDLRTKDFFGMKLFIKNFIGNEGVLSRAYSRFLRPASMKSFTIRNIELAKDEIKEDKVKDKLGRVWTRNSVKVFEAINIITYCTEMPEGTFCIGRVLNIENEYLLNVIEDNFRNFILSHLLVNPYFWETKALEKYISSGKAKAYPLMNGVTYQLVDETLKGDVSLFPFKFEIPNVKSIESVRLQTGIYKNGDKTSWAGYGLEWVQREDKKDLVCGLGLEAFNTESTFILNFLRDRRKEEKLRKIKGEDPKPLPGIWYKPFRGLKTPFQIYGYCAPLEEDPRVSGQFFVDFKNAKPFKYKYKVAQ